MISMKNIFVVDSDPSARNGISRLLLKAGYDAHSFASFTEFLDAFRPETAGCLVLDAGSCTPSGDDLRSTLESSGVNVPIIVITADDSAENRQKAKTIKAVAFLRKPVDGKALLDLVEWAMK